MLCTGLAGDCSLIHRHAFLTALNYTDTYDTKPDASYLARITGQLKQTYTQQPGVRPFAVHSLAASVARQRSTVCVQLYSIGLSGIAAPVRAQCAGIGSRQGFAILENRFRALAKTGALNMSIEQGLQLVNDTLEAMTSKDQAQPGNRLEFHVGVVD
jgi:20S proteasome alpha/beta subunit